MANIRKTFNFRNGVQVDDDNLIVSPTGLVGIGTSVPTEYLDVRGTAKVVGLVTASQIFTNSLNVGFTTDGNLGVATVAGTLNVGILTVGNVSIKSGVITSTSGIVTYYGDGRFLQGLPTSQWVDIDVGLGYTSIYAVGNVGVATIDPRFTFQVGGNNNVASFQSGVGINSTGDILATGIISATTLRGDGSLITGINASNISSGTLNNSRLPANLNISGVSTFLQSLNVTQNLNVIGLTTLTGALTVPEINGTLTLSGSTTISGSLNATGLSTISSLNVGFITATTSFIGVSTANSLKVNNLRLGVSGSSEIDTTSGDLTLNSASGNTIVNDNLSVTGISTFNGEVTVDIGIVPDVTVGAYLGKSGKEFSEAYIDTITIGVNDGKITTTSGNLILDSSSGIVTTSQNLVINGSTISYGTLTAGSNIIPTTDLNSDLGSSAFRLKRGYISYIQVGVGASNKINSTNSTDLLLDSGSGTTFIDDDLKVSGIGTFTGVLNVNSDIVPGTNNTVKLGTSTLKFSEAYINNITIGAASSTTINATSGNLILSATSGITTVSGELNVGGIFRVYQSSTLNSLTVENTTNLSTLSISGTTNATNVNVSGQLINDGGIGIESQTLYGPFQVGQENDFYSSVVGIASTVGISTTIITGINTSGITIGLTILETENLIASGTKVISIGSSQVGIGTTTLNDTEVNEVALNFGNYYNDRIFAINSTKSVGIGTTNPSAKLDVRGDARVGINTSAGVVLTSENGTKYRLIVSNAGVLSTVLVP